MIWCKHTNKWEALYWRGDLNGHIWVCRSGYEKVNGVFGYRTKNTEWESILDFVLSYNLLVANS